MVEIKKEELAAVSATVLESLLASPVQPAAVEPTDPDLIAVVGITDERPAGELWQGLLEIECPAPLTRRMAAAMFCIPVEYATLQDVRDAWSEIANIVGGCVKAYARGRGTLALPEVSTAPMQMHRESLEPNTEAVLSCGGDLLRIRVRGELKSPGTVGR